MSYFKKIDYDLRQETDLEDCEFSEYCKQFDEIEFQNLVLEESDKLREIQNVAS